MSSARKPAPYWRQDRQTGERKERTEWHSVSIGGDGLVGVAERFLRKGTKVYVEGQLRTRKWQDQSGNDRYSTEVVLNGPGAVLTMLDSATGQGGQRNDDHLRHGNQDGFGGRERPRGGGQQFEQDLDDEVPFVTCAPIDNIKRRII